MGLWDTIKSGAKSLWDAGKSVVNTAKGFFDSGGGKMVNRLLGSAGKLGLISGDTASKIGKGLGKVKDITKNASELVGVGDEIGNILNPTEE